MPSPVLVSVLIPSHNYARFLSEAVASALRQKSDSLDVEVVVADDASTDNTEAVARSLGDDIVYVRRKECGGESAARNEALARARGDFLVFLDADDLLTEGVLARHLRVFEEQPDLGLSVCRCLDIFTDGAVGENRLWPLMRSHGHIHVCNANVAPVHCFMIRSEVARQTGLFNTSLKGCADYEYWLRCFSLGFRAGVCPEGLVIYRKHGVNVTHNRPHMWMHEVVIHSLAFDLLQTSRLAEEHEKLAAWLALACGCAGVALNITFNASLRQKMQDLFAAAVHAALEHRDLLATRDPGMRRLQGFYAARACMVCREIRANLTPGALEAARILEELFPQFAARDSGDLRRHSNTLFASLAVPGVPESLCRVPSGGPGGPSAR